MPKIFRSYVRPIYSSAIRLNKRPCSPTSFTYYFTLPINTCRGYGIKEDEYFRIEIFRELDTDAKTYSRPLLILNLKVVIFYTRRNDRTTPTYQFIVPKREVESLKINPETYIRVDVYSLREDSVSIERTEKKSEVETLVPEAQPPKESRRMFEKCLRC